MKKYRTQWTETRVIFLSLDKYFDAKSESILIFGFNEPSVARPILADS